MTERLLVVVLGATGFVGTAVAARLVDRPVRLRLVGRRTAPVPAGGIADVEVVTADLTAPGAVAAAVAGADAVVHLVAHIAGESTWRVQAGDTVAHRVNVGSVAELVAALDADRRPVPPAVVFAGSLSQVGRPTGPLVTDTEPDDPQTTYDEHKLAAEHLLADATERGVLRGATLRLATVYGRGGGPVAPERGVVAAMLRKAIAGEPLTLWNDGAVARDLVNVDDVAAAFVTAIDHADVLAGQRWLIGTGVATGVGALFARIAAVVAELTGRPPVPVVRLDSEYAGSSDAVDLVCGSTAFGEATGWAPEIGLDEGLRGAATAFLPAAAPA